MDIQQMCINVIIIISPLMIEKYSTVVPES